MAITVADFLISFPEFKDADPRLLSATLARAQLYTSNLCIWGTYQQEGTFLYCARFLALSPYGRKMSLANKANETNYDVELKRVKFIVTAGMRYT